MLRLCGFHIVFKLIVNFSQPNFLLAKGTILLAIGEWASVFVEGCMRDLLEVKGLTGANFLRLVSELARHKISQSLEYRILLYI